MKQIINGKKYDTDTATLIGDYWNGCGSSDFNYISEELYQKKTGEYFLYACGGALTSYSVQVSTSTASGGSHIIPLTEAEAKNWAAEHISVDDYEALFGEVEE